VLFAWEYSTNPKWLSSIRDEVMDANRASLDPDLSREDSAIGADIDSSPALDRDFKRSNESLIPSFLSQTPNKENSAQPRQSGKSTAPRLPLPAGAAQAGGQSVQNPFAAYAQDYKLPSFDTTSNRAFGMGTPAGGTSLLAGSTAIPGSTASLFNPVNQTGTAPTSPLQAAMGRTPATNSAGADLSAQVPNNNPLTPSSLPATSGQISGGSVSPVSPLAGSRSINALPGSNIPSNPNPYNPYANYNNNYSSSPENAYGNLIRSQPVPGVPSAAPIAPSVAPPGSNPYGQSALPPNAYPGSGYTNPGFSPSIGTPAAQPIPPDPPFTAPRPIPGRYIGGGQINTFSNP
jgi:hypothetical protein